ncbi:hypothetical protein BOTCAL_0326g00060 [Botryotinia calthae]|uniref:Uncharacterized protein n=1 Tax=Botryotinia calthae TaxID=38488 RepID=A0A4Y8CW09_9HELO|nr:hypothetical protein BOTCAL_0326g00060 [Botryotinia calthae]
MLTLWDAKSKNDTLPERGQGLIEIGNPVVISAIAFFLDCNPHPILIRARGRDSGRSNGRSNRGAAGGAAGRAIEGAVGGTTRRATGEAAGRQPFPHRIFCVLSRNDTIPERGQGLMEIGNPVVMRAIAFFLDCKARATAAESLHHPENLKPAS